MSPELVDVLAAAYGTGATLGVDEVDAYLGEVGTAGPFDLTNAIEAGDSPSALEMLHRLLTASSTQRPSPCTRCR